MPKNIVITGASSGAFGRTARRGNGRQRPGLRRPSASPPSLPTPDGSTSSCTTPGTWCSALPEAFAVEQVAEVYDTNVLSTQRVHRAALPHLRTQQDGLLQWTGSTSTRGTPPYLAPYFAARAAMDSLALSYAAKVARFGIDTVIIVPGSFTTGTNHFAHAGHAADTAVAAAYEARLPHLMDDLSARLATLAPADADPVQVARQIVRVVDLPKGTARVPEATPTTDDCEARDERDG